MERDFKKVLSSLNTQQKQAVETIDGPVLVIAGPGTGKTQLVSTRVGYILQKTDTLPQNILLLTFTEAGVEAMRERLINLIGQPAYEINISTYHAFGSELIRRYPDFFEEADMSPIDDLGQSTIIKSITGRLPYDNPLRYSGDYYGDVLGFISDSKRALLRPQDIFAITRANLKFIEDMNKATRPVLDGLKMVNKASVNIFEQLLELGHRTQGLGHSKKMPDAIIPLGKYTFDELRGALAEFDDTQKTVPLTKWKNAWLEKDSEGRFIFTGRRQNLRLVAAAEVYDLYQKELARRRLFDYDDMILRAIDALQKNPDFKYSLAEQYQYIMLDEFQDTNQAQFRLIELLTDHPANEARPNVLAVGDDDQAIYAFQGADHANMLNFAKSYKDVKIISLEQNYRSQPDIVSTAKNISDQISERLHHNFKAVSKDIKPAAKDKPKNQEISAHEFKTDGAQYDWVAAQIKRLIGKDKLEAKEIAVLAPKHRYLIEFLPYLARHDIPVHYEKRENVLDSPIVRQLEQMARLVLALQEENKLANSLWPEVLSYDFWGLKTEKIWQLSWEADEEGKPWVDILLKDKQTHDIALFFLRLKDMLGVTILEEQLDALIGINGRSEPLNLPISSPLFDYYFGSPKDADAISFSRFLSNLNVLRFRLREHQRAETEPLNLRNFVEFIDANRAAQINILDSSPYYESPEAVQLMTAYGSKGREFKAVFIIAAVDEVWGSASRNQGYRISLPENLSFIRYQGASEDERLRLLYVAATRAKTHLYFTGYDSTLAGRDMTRLKYLQIGEEEDGVPKVYILPPPKSTLITDTKEDISADALLDYWTDRHQPPFKPGLKELLEPRLKRYQLNPTHLNHFVDLVNHGPADFFIYCILRFPRAPSIEASYGTAVHNSLRWLGFQITQHKPLPARDRFLKVFEQQLGMMRLPEDDYNLLRDRGRLALDTWYIQQHKNFGPNDRFEVNFARFGVFAGGAHLSGKIDWMSVDEKTRTISIIDFKTGRGYSRWQQNVLKLHRYRQQLLTYQLLVANSGRFKTYRLDKVALEFVEPDEDGRIVRLELPDDKKELERHAKLLQAVWKHVMELNFPDVSKYPPTIKGITDFENDLIGK
jgi:DNA helicase-2/ATP-dependent DNA helicase PcrA